MVCLFVHVASCLCPTCPAVEDMRFLIRAHRDRRPLSRDYRPNITFILLSICASCCHINKSSSQRKHQLSFILIQNYLSSVLLSQGLWPSCKRSLNVRVRTPVSSKPQPPSSLEKKSLNWFLIMVTAMFSVTHYSCRFFCLAVKIGWACSWEATEQHWVLVEQRGQWNAHHSRW